MITAILGLALLATPIKHSAVLRWNWTQGTKEPAQGFFITRSSFFGHTIRLGRVAPSTRTYTDTTVVNGAKYTYAIVAYNTAGHAPNSNKVTVTIPK